MQNSGCHGNRKKKNFKKSSFKNPKSERLDIKAKA
jgi:hypothetical protein